MTRKRNYKKHYPCVAEMIATHYSLIRDSCNASESEDLFSETTLYVMHDPESLKYKTVDSFITYFKRRLNMIRFQTIQDNKNKKEIPYADYLQAKKETE